MQAVPALDGDRVAAELGVAGDAPDVGGDLVLLGEHLLRAEHLIQDGAGAEELHGGLCRSRRAELVNAPQDAFLGARPAWPAWRSPRCTW